MKISETVLTVLSRSHVEGDRLVLPTQLDRKLYVDVAKVIEAAGGRWNRKAKAHLVEGTAEDALEPLLLTGEYARTKQDFGQFDTPRGVVETLMALADVRPGAKVLEPSVGLGRIAQACEAAGAIVTAHEIDEKRLAKARETCRLEGGVAVGDFLQATPDPVHDRVVMNPPFARRADLRHVLHAHRFLAPAGRLVAVMSAGILFREDRETREFRDFVNAHGGSIERLPEKSFHESGTSVTTCIAVLYGRDTDERARPTGERE